MLTETAGKPPDIILIATGSEVQLAVDAKTELEKRGRAVRVVSMPSFELFEAQDEAYRDTVLPPSMRRVSRSRPARRYPGTAGSAWTGDIIGMTTFGASAPYQDVMKHFGFTVENVVARALKLLKG